MNGIIIIAVFVVCSAFWGCSGPRHSVVGVSDNSPPYMVEKKGNVTRIYITQTEGKNDSRRN